MARARQNEVRQIEDRHDGEREKGKEGEKA